MSSPTGHTGATSDRSPVYHYPIQFLPINPIVPFTKRDGHTFIEALNWLRDWLVDELLPAINNGFQDYAERVQAAIDELENAINTAREHGDRAEAAAAQAAETIATVEGLLQDTIGAADAAAASAVAAEQARQLSDAIRVAVESIRDAVAAIRDETADIRDDVENIASGVSQDSIVNNIVTNESSATRGTLDTLYAPTRDIMVVVGASNCVIGTWTTKVANALGLTEDNYAIGGTGFMNGSDTNRWRGQADRIVAAYSPGGAKHGDLERVGYVFVAGGGVDASNKDVNINTEATHVYSTLAARFPNARLITVPGLWRHNEVWAEIVEVSTRMRRLSMRHGWECIWHGWEWLYNRSDLMESDGNHPNDAGYEVFTDYILAGMRGVNTSLAAAGNFTPNASWNADPTWRRRVFSLDGFTHVNIEMTRNSDLPVEGTHFIGQINNQQLRPATQKAIVARWNETDWSNGFIDTSGFVRLYLPTGTRRVNVVATWAVGT